MSRALLAVSLAAAAPGCFWFATKHEKDVLREDVQSLEVRIARQEEAVDTKVKTLDDSIEKATKLLARNSADLGTEVQKLADELTKLGGQIQSMQREVDAAVAEVAQLKSEYEAKVAAFEARVAVLEKPAVAPPVIDKEALFEDAYKKLQAGQYDDARKLFREFVAKFGQDEKADNAYYWVGDSFYREKSYIKAIAEFTKLRDKYPNGDMVDDAFFQAGMAALDMRACTEANAYFGELVRLYPSSTFVKQAKEKLEYIKKNVKQTKVCQS